MSDVAYIFSHFNKTGGSSLRKTLFVRFPENTGLFYPYYTTMDNKTYMGRPIVRSDVTDRAKVFMGALVYYGMHEDLGRDGKYIYFLRNPIQKLISWYHHDYIEYTRNGKTPLELEAWIEACPRVSRTEASRTFVYALVEGSHLPMTMDNAKMLLKQSAFIGFQETFASDLQQMFSPSICIASENITKNKCQWYNVTLKEFGDRELELIREACGDDIELYQYARDLRENGHNNGFKILTPE